MSEAWNTLHWTNPWWLLLALIPLPLLLLRGKTAFHPRLTEFIQRHLWSKVLSTPLQTNRRRKALGFLIIWTLLSIALAGPFLAQQKPEEIEKLAANIVVIMDISPSMGTEDIYPSRLEQAKKLVADFSQRLTQHRLALIAFSANAYTVLPLTHDSDAFRHFLNQLDPSLAYVTGSNLGRALRLSKEALATEEQQTGGLVLLVSDGEIHDQVALAGAANLKQAGHKLITLGIGTEQGGPVPLAGGRLVRQNGAILTSQLQRETLQALAQAGGGRYFDLRPEIWPEIESDIDKLQLNRYKTEINTRMGQPLFPVLILLALVMLFWQTLSRPQGLVLVIAALVAFNSQPADAAPWTEAKGLKQLQAQDNQGALKTYDKLDTYAGLMGKGVAAYRLQQWQAALTAFRQAFEQANTPADKARAAYNMGNTHTQLHQLDQAIAAFERAIQLQSTYPRASYNLTLLNKARQEWGGQQQADKAQARPGPSQAEEQIKTGAGGDASSSPISGQSERNARISAVEGKQDGKQEKQDAVLSQSLAQWSQMKELDHQPPAQAWQQYQNLREENQIMLQRRFEVEDKQVSGLVEQKPW